MKARVLYVNPQDGSEIIEVAGHQIQFGGFDDKFCFEHRRMECLGELSDQELQAVKEVKRSSTMKTPAELAAQNLAEFMEHGPGLRSTTRTWIEARDPKHNAVLLGGLGGCGVGQMWVTEDEGHKTYSGYAEAEIIENTHDPRFSK